MKSFTTAQIAAAAKCWYDLNEGFDGEPVCPRSFTNDVLNFLDKYGTPDASVLPPIEEIRKANGICHVQIGDWVKVIKGKKVRLGTEGKVTYLKEQEFDGKKVTRVKIEDASGNLHDTYTYNLEKRA